MKKIFTSCAVALAATLGLSANAQNADLYLRGSLLGWNTLDETNQFTTTDGENYTLSLDKLSGDFKIADSTWGQYNFGSASNIDLDTEYTLTNSSTSGNCSLREGSATNVTIYFTLSTGVLKISGTEGTFEYPDLYIIGDYSSWDFAQSVKMERNDKVYTATVASFPAGGFKIAADGYAPNFGSDEATPEIAVGTLFNTATNGNNITLATDVVNAKFTFTYEREGASTLLIESGEEAVATIGADNTAAKVYYTVDGVRVDNPTKGLYIVKQGDKVTKTIVR